MSHWSQHAIFWHVYPLGFAGAPIREDAQHAPDARAEPADGLRRLTGWLDYLLELGCNGLLLGPVHTSATHGYDTLDHRRIDPRLGTEADMDALLAACRERGVRVLMDGVFSHVSSEHPAVRQALAEGPDSAAARLVDIDWDFGGGPRPHVFEGHDSLARLRHETDETRAAVRAVMEHWLERGIDGWRLDAAYSVAPAFWAAVIPPVRERFPDAWFLGEVIHGDYPQLVADSHLDSLTQYELWTSIRSSVQNRNLFELDWNLRRHQDFLASFVPQTFIGNHDVTRVATALEHEGDAASGQRGAVVALAILLMTGGIPSIYAGDEQGFVGLKEERLGGDDAIRPAFPADPSALSPLGEGVHRAHQELIGMRRRHPWLTTARSEMLELTNERAILRSRPAEGTREESQGDAFGPEPFLDLRIDLTDAANPQVRITDPDGAELFAR